MTRTPSSRPPRSRSGAARTSRSPGSVGARSQSRTRSPASGFARTQRSPRPAARSASRAAPTDFERGTWPDVGRALKAQDWDALKPSLAEAGMDRASYLPRLRHYCQLLLQWNRKVSNLISRNDKPRLVSRHVVESVAAIPWLREIERGDWMDLGSGGGLPALPLILAGIGEQWVLVESRRTKCLFLRRVVQELKLENVTVEQARLEDLVDEPRLARRFSGFTSRATLNLGETLAIAPAFLKPGGAAFLWKGSRLSEELAGAADSRAQWNHDGTRIVGSDQSVVAKFVFTGA